MAITGTFEGGLAIDWAHPVNRLLRHAWIFDNPTVANDLVGSSGGPLHLTTISGLTTNSVPYGYLRGTGANPTTAHSVGLLNWAEFNKGPGFSLSIWVSVDTTSGNYWFMSQGGVNTSWEIFSEGGSIFYRVGSTSNVFTSVPYAKALMHLGASQDITGNATDPARLYINGRQVHAASVNFLPSPTGSEIARFGSYDGASGYALNGTIGFPRLWNRALASNEMVELAADPMYGFLPARRRSYFVPAAAPAGSVGHRIIGGGWGGRMIGA